MDQLFRISCGLKRDPAIKNWFDHHSSELGAIAKQWFKEMHHCGGDVLELIHDACPVVCIDDVPFAYVNVFKAHVNVGFFRGAFLPDPDKILEGNGKRMRHVKIKVGQEVNEFALKAMIHEAYRDIKNRIQHKD